MMYCRPSQPRATSKPRLFKRLAGTIVTATLSLSVLGPTEVTRIDSATASDFDGEISQPLETATLEYTCPRPEASDNATGPELLRTLSKTAATPRGTAMLASWSAAPQQARLVRMRVTAYCPCDICCGPLAQGITASGHRVSVDKGRFVAADPALAFGTRLVVPGYNAGRPVRVLDRGGAIRGRCLDVYFDSHERAREWGVRYLAVAIMPGR